MLANARVARLAMRDERALPRVLPVTFVLVSETIWSAIDSKPKRSSQPARVARLRRRPEAALVVDHYEQEWGALAWVEAIGRVAVVEVADHPDVLAALQVKYPQYRDQPPAGPLLGLHIERVVCWRAADFA
jgi:PPOX class probable F420-dependent enzyme